MTGRGPTRQKIADKAQGVASPTVNGTHVFCFAARRVSVFRGAAGKCASRKSESRFQLYIPAGALKVNSTLYAMVEEILY
jgi:hypothetical protein